MRPRPPSPRGDNEFARAGLTMAECRLVAAPRVAESPAALECKVVEVVENQVLERRVTEPFYARRGGAFHIDERFLVDGRFDTARAGRSPVAATRTTRRSRPCSRWRAQRAAVHLIGPLGASLSNSRC